MSKDEKPHQVEASTESFNAMLKRALATPPISNEDILKRSKSLTESDACCLSPITRGGS